MKKVLIVEDDTSLQKILAKRLSESGVEILSSTTVQGADTLIKINTPDLILLDVMLPGGMNGFDFLEKIKRDEKFKKIPVIILTNLDTEKKTAFDMGVVDYLVKPDVSIDEIVLKVNKYLH